MKRFMYLSVSLLCLALATLIGFHIGQGTAGAQSGSMITGMSAVGQLDGSSGVVFVMTASGECFMNRFNNTQGFGYIGSLTSLGNFWDSGPTSVTPSTWSEIKAKFAPPK